jgi:hypothetical protein
MNTLIIAYTVALPFVAFLVGVMYGGAEERKAQKNKSTVSKHEFTHTYPSINRYKRYIRAQKN